MRGIRNRAMRKVMQKLKNEGVIANLTAVIADAECEILTAAKRLDDATGQGIIESVPDREERRDDLGALVEALGKNEMPELWIENVAPELLDTTDGIEGYLGMDADEWEAQIERWADFYRENGSEGSDRALADHHIRGKWGVDIETFEQRVVEWSQGKAAERLFAANFRAAVTVMHGAADELEGADP